MLEGNGNPTSPILVRIDLARRRFSPLMAYSPRTPRATSLALTVMCSCSQSTPITNIKALLAAFIWLFTAAFIRGRSISAMLMLYIIATRGGRSPPEKRMGFLMVGTFRYSEYLLLPTKHLTRLQSPEKEIERYFYGTVMYGTVPHKLLCIKVSRHVTNNNRATMTFLIIYVSPHHREQKGT